MQDTQLDMVIHSCWDNIQDRGEAGMSRVQGQPGLHGETLSQFFSFSFSSFFLPSLPPYLFSPKGREQHWEDSLTYSDLEFCAVLQSQLSPIQEGTRTPGRGDAGFIPTNDHLDHRRRDHTEKHLPLCFVTSPGDHPFMVTLRLK